MGSISVSQRISSPLSTPMVISEKEIVSPDGEGKLTNYWIGGCGSFQEPFYFAAI